MLMPSIFGEDLFDDFIREFPFYNDRDMKNAERKLYGHHGKNMMKTDVRELDNGYELEMDLPGFKKEEIKASLDNGYLTITAEKGLNEEERDERNGKYIRRERFTGMCERSFYVGKEVREEDIKARFEHGILKLVIPKKEVKPAVEANKYIAIEG